MKRLLIAPHRIGFFCGSVTLLAALFWWLAEMAARSTGSTLTQASVPMLQHGYLMLYGFFPLFMLGFIYTAGPRWLNVAPPPLARYAPVIAGYAAGSVLFLASSLWPSLRLIALLLHALAWGAALLIWWGRIRTSKQPDRRHAIGVGLAFALGWAGILLALHWHNSGQLSSWQAMVEISLWGFLLPVFFLVCHRMVPFFSANVLMPYQPWRPDWLLLLPLLMLGHAALAIAQLSTLPADLPLAAVLLYTSWRWQLQRSFKVPLLAMLHASFAWAGLSLLLYALSGLLILSGQAGLGFAPLHALTLGFMLTMLLGFVTRVTLGHSGRPLQAGRLAWTLYWLMHGVALARVGGEIWPARSALLYPLAALLACAGFALWGRVYLPMYWQARADGQAG
ncbi:NnrS family protein [Chitinibacter sp. ZOR0017]|uniref:NnrS family protein n=1 Tax=Chitinibacter sp. ZOR0017 TaxID=1339254 RepID=UPI0009E0859D|nr:NnrS family protein [Chitinibacter sp. ZOR0017]